MNSWVDELGYLARSENRVQLLRVIESAQPCGRRDLQATANVSRVTLSRTLRGFESRGWVRPGTTGYETTPLGDLVLADLERLEEDLRLSTRLGPIIEYLPFDCFDFDIRRLADAEVVTPTSTHPLAPVTRADELMETAREVKILAETVTNSTVDTQRKAVDRGQRADIVLSDELFRTLAADDRLAESFCALLQNEPVSAFHYGDGVPLTLGLYDGERVGFGIVDDEGFPRAVIVTEDPVVVEQVDQFFEEYREASVPLSPETFE